MPHLDTDLCSAAQRVGLSFRSSEEARAMFPKVDETDRRAVLIIPSPPLGEVWVSVRGVNGVRSQGLRCWILAGRAEEKNRLSSRFTVEQDQIVQNHLIGITQQDCRVSVF